MFSRVTGWNRVCLAFLVLAFSGPVLFPVVRAGAVDLVPNGAFDADLSGWTNTVIQSSGIREWDSTVYGLASGSFKYRTNSGNSLSYQAYDLTTLSGPMNPGDTVTLSFYWYKTASGRQAGINDISLVLVAPSSAETVLWSESSRPLSGQVLDGTVSLDISTSVTETGTYQLKISGSLRSGSFMSAQTQVNLDDIVLDAQPPPNNPPTVTVGAMQASVSPVERLGTETTVLSAAFSDADQPGAAAFTVTMKIREPDNATELVLVNALTDGNGGLTITDDGGGNYTASYTYDPADSQTLGLYDLYFEVSDGADTASDGYANNADELEITTAPVNSPPVVAAGATQAVPAQVDRIGSDATTLSADFTDADQPGVAAFTVSFSVREPDETTVVYLVLDQPDGSGGVTIADNGGGSYTASYVYNPGDAQPTGFYDLYFSVSDGADQAVDGFTNNPNELQVITSSNNEPPTLSAGATSVSPGNLDRLGAATTQFSADFSDLDASGPGAFSVTFKARAPYAGPVYLVSDALTNGQGGLTITDNGGGAFTASIAWDPPDDAPLGYYDLACLVDDGIDTGLDDYPGNPDELLITGGGENNPPIVAGDAVYATPAAVERVGANVTTLGATFSDADLPGAGGFTVTFKLRLPDDASELILADAVGDGVGGVTITDLGSGVYKAEIGWDPPDVQTVGLYDLFFAVSDGAATGTDGYPNNLDELEVHDALINNPVSLTASTTSALPVSVTRLGEDFTMLQAEFQDPDLPGPGAFTIDFKVRDTGAAEYAIVTAARDGQQGLRVQSLGGGSYRASVLWDPPVGQVTGTYDLYFQVDDGSGPAAVDGYANNADELTVTATAIPGDGYLLHRSHDASTCGGPAAACHDVTDHQGQSCLVCHEGHGTANIYLIKETIQTPNSGPKAVLFKTLGIGDPYNDPDPVVGDPNSGAMADDSDGAFTGVCEVCHTATSYHRNDGSQPQFGHHNAETCKDCHSHSDSFAPGESSGGSACACHSALFDPMNTSTSSYHHQINGNTADYAIASRTCLMCHVDHDIFRGDLNPGVGTRAKNLRRDITTTVTAGDANVLADTDYLTTGTGGICLSCHTSAQVKGYAQPDGTTETIAIDQAAYGAATLAHNYTAPSTFTKDGSVFNANCSKCHTDDRAKNYQDAGGNTFGTHDSSYRTMVRPFDVTSPADPLEEKHCLQCHSSLNPNDGGGLDYYGVQPMSAAARGIGDAVVLTYAHPISAVNGVHFPGEDGANLGDGSRHAECVDCHNPHAADQGTHDGSSSLVSNALKGVWGVEPTSWPAAPTPADNGNVFAAVPGYTQVDPATSEYQICLKCHSDYVTLPTGSPNLAEQINPNYPSVHGITAPGTNAYCNTNTMNEPWASSGTAYCSDCHRSGNSADPEGPHGSNLEHLLVATVVSDATNGTPLCMVCHKTSVYWSGSEASFSRMSRHPASTSAHRNAKGCFACHMWEYSPTAGLGVNTDTGAGAIYVHGMNKKWVYYEGSGSAGSGQMSDAFVDGYISNMDFVNKSCWTNTCRTHSGRSY